MRKARLGHGSRRLYLLVVIALTATQTLPAQSNYPNVMVIDGQLFYPPCEPAIALNRNNPSEVVAGAVLNHVAVSLDSGKTWKQDKLRSRYGVFGDPCIVSGNGDKFYYFHLSNPTGLGWASAKLLDRIVCQPSRSRLGKWKRGYGIGLSHPKDQDKEWAHWDPVSEQLILCWTQFDLYGSSDEIHHSNILESHSADGVHWSVPHQVNTDAGNCLDNSYTTEGATPASGPDGSWYLCWNVGGRILLDVSKDRGLTWLDNDITIVDDHAFWSFDIPGIGRANGMPIIKCDMSESAHRGTLYVNWADQRNGTGDTDIWLKKSSDGGLTWSTPKRVNDDGPGRHQFFTWMDVDPSTGYIYIVFYDRRNYSDNQTDVYLATSTDGGETFVNERISERPFVPNSRVFFGDYNNISAVNGVIRPIWTRSENGRQSVWTAIINK